MSQRVRGRPRSGGHTLNRTETVTLRLDKRLRYLTELAARKQRRTVSAFIEWAIEQTLPLVVLDETTGETVTGAGGTLWEPDVTKRLLKLAQYAPDLLTYDEEVSLKRRREQLS